MTVLWQADEAAASATIAWGPTPALESGPVTVQPGGDHLYRFDLGGLAPGARCYYRVTLDAAVRDGSFLAAPAAGAERTVLYAYGDTRNYPERQNRVLRRLLEDVAVAPDRRQTLLLCSGDLVEFGLSELAWDEQFFNRAYPWLARAQRELPLLVTRGNHESTGELLRKYFPLDYTAADAFYLSLDYGPAHLAVVDDQAPREAGSPQYLWLDADLAAALPPFRFALFHKPAWGAGGGHANDLANQQLTAEIFEPRGLAAALTGHNHYYARNAKAGIFHVTTGGGGAPLHTPDPSYPYHVTSSRSFHFTRLSLKDGTVHLVARDDAGRVLDSAYLALAPDAGAPGVEAVRATTDALSVRVHYDECVQPGVGPHGAENPALYELPGHTIRAAARGEDEDTVLLSVAPALPAGSSHLLTVREVADCAAPANALAAPVALPFRFDEGPGAVIEQGDTWAYFRGLSDPGAGWAAPGFDDSAWSRGPSGFGYANADDATALWDMQGSYSTVFLRRTFEVCNAPAVRAVALAIDYDDGFAAYLNGVRVAGRNDAGFDGHDHRALASGSHDAGTWETIDLSAHRGLLRGGSNVLAIVLLNDALAGWDATLIPELALTGGYCADAAPPGEVAGGAAAAGQLAWPDRETLAWPLVPEATAGYALYRGEREDLAALATPEPDACLRLRTLHNDETTARGLVESPAERPGRLYWYLVTGINALGEGSAGNGSAGSRQLNSRGECR
jgi:hypothetical protein